MGRKKKPIFEDHIDLIDNEIRKRKGKWNLTAITWIDFDDVSQIIRIHIYKKWNLYDSSKPLIPWINRIISNQIKNIEYRRISVVSCTTFDDLVLVLCGRYIKYAKLNNPKNVKMELEDEFKDA